MNGYQATVEIVQDVLGAGLLAYFGYGAWRWFMRMLDA
jgi:TRAP-type C4-dicarboxylate transport system permease small subunit